MLQVCSHTAGNKSQQSTGLLLEAEGVPGKDNHNHSQREEARILPVVEEHLLSMYMLMFLNCSFY